MFNGMTAMANDVHLESGALIEQARVATGLSDFGADEGFFERVEVYLTALRDEANLSPVGVVTSAAQVSQILANRLLVTDFVARHPEALAEPIAAPIVIVGLPRTGTTHLHNLMAADPSLRSLPYWESLEPVPPLGEQHADEADQRQARCAAGVWFVDEVMPDFKRMHEMTVEHVHEEIQLLAIDCSTMLFETATCSPLWRDYYKARDQQSSYHYLRRVLQVCQYQSRRAGNPVRRWVLKSPQHLEQVPAVLGAFPDATLVFTHRDPVSVIASFVTMAAYTARISKRAPIDLALIGTYWCDRILDLYDSCVRDRDVVPPGRAIDVHFDVFMADDVATVEQVYRVAQQPFGPDTRDAMEAFMVEHPRGKFGGVEYNLAQFGLDPGDIRRRAGAYIQRFDVKLEDRW